jgi:hypothetical protein
MLGFGIFSHLPQIQPLGKDLSLNFKTGLSTLGGMGMLALFLRAYSLGGGTYTGIEAVSNGLQILREPRVQNGKRTMFYMATSLALTAGGLFICYLLLDIKPQAGKTLNSVLAQNLYGRWPMGQALALVTIISEGALLLIAAQAGFIDGPRVMANMAVDSWFPHRFSAISERLTMRNGVLLMGGSALMLLLYTQGKIGVLVVMYSINVFLTFSISQLGMARFFMAKRKSRPKWKANFTIHAIGLILCMTILCVTAFEKFAEGGWVTLLITLLVIVQCHLVKTHYLEVKETIKKFDDLLIDIPAPFPRKNELAPDPKENTAIQLVSGFNGFGIHTFLSILRNFPGLYKNFIFISVAVVDSGSFKGTEQIINLEASATNALKQYADLANRFGFPSGYRMVVDTEVVEAATRLCQTMIKEYPRATIFSGQLTFKLEKLYHRFLHNETAFAIQRRLQWSGITNVILPIRMDL